MLRSVLCDTCYEFIAPYHPDIMRPFFFFNLSMKEDLDNFPEHWLLQEDGFQSGDWSITPWGQWSAEPVSGDIPKFGIGHASKKGK